MTFVLRRADVRSAIKRKQALALKSMAQAKAENNEEWRKQCRLKLNTLNQVEMELLACQTFSVELAETGE